MIIFAEGMKGHMDKGKSDQIAGKMNNRNLFNSIAIFIGVILSLGSFSPLIGQATITSTATGGDWGSTSSWVGDLVPQTTDFVVIASGATINTVNSQTCAGITITGTLNMASSNVLTVNGNVSGNGTWSASSSTRNIVVRGNWTFNGTSSGSGTVTFSGSNDQTLSGKINSGNGGKLTIDKSGGVVSLLNSITMNSSGSTFTLTSGTFDPGSSKLTTKSRTFTAGTLRVGAAVWSDNYSGTITQPAVGIIEYNANGNQTVNNVAYPGHLLISGSGTKTYTVSTARIITGSLTINSGAEFATAGSFTITVTGITTIDGTMTIGGAALRTFTGNILIDIGGTWNATSVSGINIGGNLQFDGSTFTSGSGTYTFNGSGKTLSGTGIIPITAATFSGTYTNNDALSCGTLLVNSTRVLTNNGTITATTSLGGSGELVQGGTGTLNIGSGSTIGILNATASGNKVNYTGGAQSVKATTYADVIFSGTGAKTIATGTEISGNLSIAGSPVTANITTGLSINVGTLTLGGLNKINGTWGNTASAATYNDNNYFTATSGVLNVINDSRPTPLFSGITGSQSQCFGTATVTLSGTVSAPGPIYALNGGIVTVNINGVNQTAIISGGSGSFSVTYNTSAIPASLTPYTITYSFPGDVNLTAPADEAATTLTVNATTITAQSTAAQSQCFGGTFTPITVTASGTGLSYQWFSNTSAVNSGGSSLGAANGAQTSSYTPQTNVVGTLFYYCVATGSICGSATSAISGAFIVSGTPVAPTLGSAVPASGSVVCVGYNDGIVTGTGGFGGEANEYQVSINGGASYISYTNGAAISTSGATGNIIVQGRRTGGATGCSDTPWSTLSIWNLSSATINASLNAATPTTGTTICAGYSPSATITAGTGGSTGATDLYEYSINGGTGWSAYTPGAAITTTVATTNVQIRVSRSAGSYGCSATGPTTIVTWPVSTTPVAPTLSAASPAVGTTICADFNTGTVTATGGSGGSTGAANEYQVSINGGTTFSAYTNGAAISTTGATGSVIVQARRTSGDYGCTSTPWSTICTWTISSPTANPTLNVATPSNGSSICQGYSPSATFNAGTGGSTGAADLYEYSIDGGSNWSVYTAGAAITTTGATTSVKIRASRSGGSYGCSGTTTTNLVTWLISSATVNPQLNNSTPSSGSPICTGYTPSAIITPGSGGSTGAADLYEYSINGGTNWFTYTSGTPITTTGATTSVQVRISRTAGSYGCSAMSSLVVVTWPVNSPTVNPTLGSATPGDGVTICAGYSPVAVITAGTGGSATAADTYEYSINNGGTWSAYTSGVSINTTSATGSVKVRGSRSAGSFGCSPTGPTVIVSWPISAAVVNPTLNLATPISGTAVCAGYTGPGATITAGSGGSSGAADVYEYSINNGGAWSTYVSGNPINTTGATTNILIRVSRTAGSYGCTGTGPTTIVTWPVAANPVSPTLSLASPISGSTICAGYNTGTVTGTGGSGGSAGAANEYQVSIDGGGAYNIYTNGAAINTAGATGSVIVQARRTGGSYGCSATSWTTICSWTVSAATVNPTLNAATPANGTSICAGYSVSATITAGSGGSVNATDTYEYSINNGGAWTAYTSGSTINTALATGNVLIRASRSSGSYGCSPSGPITIVNWPISSATVSPILGVASPVSGSTVCASANSGSVTGSGGSGGSTGAANEYQLSIDGGNTYSAYTSGAAINTTSATGNIIVQARRTGGSYGCSDTGWTTICTWTMNPQPGITLGSNPSVNQGTTSASLTYSATTNSPNQYSIDYDAAANTAGFIDVTNVTLGASPITLTVPAAPALATYNGILTVRNSTTGCVSQGYAISVTVGLNLLNASFLSAAQSSLNESGTITVSVILSATSASAVTVPFTVNASSTAIGGGTDYTITSSPITIPAGETTGAITITIANDALDESDETVVINMGSPSNAILGALTTHTATFTDDDPYPTGSIAVNRGGISTDPASLVNNILLNGCLVASNITFSGNAAQIGHFTSGGSSLPIAEGVILSTGNVASAEGPNKDFGTTAQYVGAGDTYINTISGGTSYDAAVLEFDFIPEGNVIQFNYIFASEEYAEFVGEVSNDAFAFLLSGPGITGTENIALITSTATPVSINTLHGQGNQTGTSFPSELLALLPYPTNFGVPYTKVTDDAIGYFGTAGSRYYYQITPINNAASPPVNASYYVDNGQFIDRDIIASNGRKQVQYLNQSGQVGSSEMEFDGRTTKLTASHAVTACQTYHIKIVIADVNDQKWDSGVFLEAKSFTSNEVAISSHIGAIAGDATNMYEGCEGSFIRYQRADGADNSAVFTFPVILAGTATNGVDFVYTTSGGTIIGDGTFPGTATIPAGQDIVDYYYKAQSDGLIEGNETIVFKVSNGCPCDPLPTYLEKTVTIVDVPQIQASTVSVIQCVSSGNPVANITINMQGGLNPNDYQYSMDGGTFQASNVFTLNSAVADGSDIIGTSHYVTVKDQYSCNSITENNIIIPSIAPFAAQAGSDISMCEGQSGVQLNGSGGLYYTWTMTAGSPADGTSYLSGVSVANPTISNSIPPGTYWLTLTAQDVPGDSPSCHGHDDMILTVKPRPVVSASANTYSGCNGTGIQLAASVIAGASYLWNPATDLSNSTISNPVYTPAISSYLAQFFTVTATGSNGCSTSASTPGIYVYPSPLITTGAIVDATCGAANGSATVSASSPGTTPAPSLSYLWDAAAGNQASATATGLAAGTYTVTVTDTDHGCSSTKLVTVASAADVTPPTAVCQAISVTLDGSGNATITPADINNGSSDNCTSAGSLIMSLSKSTFNSSDIGTPVDVTLTVTDGSGNTSTCQTTVTVSFPATCGAGGSQTIYKESFGTGTINGGYTPTGSAVYTISSMRMRVLTNSNTSDFFLSRTIDISSYTNLNVSVSIPAQNGLDAGSDPIQLWYSVDGAAFVQFANNGLLYGTTTGTSCSYIPNGLSVQIKILCLQNGATEWREFDDVTLTGDPAMEATAAITNVTCNGDANGAINVSVTKGVAPYTYAWTTFGGSGLNATAEDQTGLTAGTYNLVVTDANNVVSDAFTFTVTQPAAVSITTGLTVSDASVCNPAGGNAAFTITAAQSGVHYEIKTLAGTSLSPAVTGTGTGSDLSLTILQANIPTPVTTTSYTYKVVATSASGCSPADLTDQPTLTVNYTDPPTGNATQSFCSINGPKVSNLYVTGTGIIWYNAASGGSVVPASTNLVNGTTYYASRTDGYCESPARLAVTAVVYATPTIQSITHGVICGSGTVTLHAAASTGTVNWYAAQTGGSPIGTGNDFTTPTISTTTSYWVDGTNNGCTTSTRSEVIATAYSLPTITYTAIPAICSGAATATLSYSTTTGGANQYSITFDETALSNGFVNVAITTLPASQISITVPGGAPAGTYYGSLFVKNSANSCVSTTNSISIVISGLTAISSQSTGAQSTCINGSFSPISVTASGAGLSYQWFSNTSASNTGGSSLGAANGAQTNTYTPQASVAGTLYYYCTVTGTCGPAVTSAVSGAFVVYPVTTASISGGTTPLCYNTAPGTLTAAGGGGNGAYTYLWFKNGVSTGVTTQTYTPGNLTATSAIYCAITSGNCSTVNSNTINITVYSNLSANISGGSTPVCFNTSPGPLSASATGGTGSYTYQWWTTTGIINGATNSTYTPGNITLTTGYYCKVTSGSCGTVSTPTTTILVNSALTADISGGTTPLCNGGAPGTFTATGGGGTGVYTYLWYKNGTSTGVTTSTYTPGALTSSSSFYCAITSGTCGTLNTATTTITVYPNVTAGIGGGNTPICYGTSAGTLTATGAGGTGFYTYQWHSTAGIISGQTNATYSPGSLTTTTGYYCAVTSTGSCGTANTPTTTITVRANLIASITGGTSPLCYNLNPGTLTASSSGGAGSHNYLWYKDGVSTSVTTQTYDPGNLTASASFYCVVTDASCGNVTTNTISIIVYGNLSAAISGGTTPLCYNTAPGTFTATGSGGNGTYTYLWYKNGSSTGITTQNYAPGSLTETSTFYCAITSGTCGTVNTSTTTITVNPVLSAGISGGASPICYNTDAGTLTASGSGGTGSYTYQWYSTSGIISGETNASYSLGNLTSTTGYYCAVTSGTCGTVNTTTTTITVFGNLTAGISGGTSPLCYNGSPGMFTATGSGGTGSYTYQWYTTTGIISGATSQTYSPGSLTSTTGYYCAITSGSCGTVNTSTTTITVYPLLTASVTGGSTPICYNSGPGTFSATGGGGNSTYTYLWYKDGVSTGITTQDYTPDALTASATFYCAISSGSCGPVNSNSRVITVTPQPNASISYSTPFCTSVVGAQSVTRTGTAGGSYSSTAGLTIDPGTGAITPSSSTAGTYTVTYTIAAYGGCSEYSTTFDVTIIHDLIWTGNVSNDWNTAGNWSCQVVPDLTTNVTIPDVTNDPILNSGVAGLAKDITLASGSSLTVIGNTLKIAGDISNSGTFNATAGTIEMKGSAVQTIGAGVFATNTILHLTVNNSDGATLLGQLNVTGIVKAQAGNLTSNGNLTLISTATQTALIDGAGSGDVVGSVTMQRYLPTAFGYKYFSSPFQSATVSEFSDDIDVTATFPTFYKYDENHRTNTDPPVDMSGWTTYTSLFGALNPLEGYAANFGKVTSVKTADMTGVVTNGSISKTLQNHNRTFTQGYNLVGNPYPSPIDWDASGWTKTNIDDALYFFNASAATGDALADDSVQYQGTYTTYINGTGTGNGDNVIASMQGFFVHVNSTSPVDGVLGVSNSVRVNDLNPSFKKVKYDPREILRFTAYLESEQAVEDVALMYFDASSTLSFDKAQDALKLKNTDPTVPNLYTFSLESKQLSINGLPSITDSITEIPLGIHTLKSGRIVFNAKDISELPYGLHLYLLDAEKSVLQDLQENPEYRIDLKAGEYNRRFSLVFSKTELENPAQIVKTLFAIYRSGNLLLIRVNLPYNTGGDLLLMNTSGQIVLQRPVFGSETVQIDPNVTAGLYILTVRSATRVQSEKLLMRLNYE